MEKSLNFNADVKPISKILFANDKFRIPRYQRPYAWEEDQISDFWNDLITDGDPLFLGSLIFNNEHKKETGYVDVIDGQQRLLSITIFIAVLRDVAKDIDIEIAKLYQRQDISIEDRTGGESYRILCGDSTQSFFKKYIQEGKESIAKAIPQTKEELKVKKNYEFLLLKVVDELKKFAQNSDKVRYLNKLRDKVSDLYVIDIQIGSEEEAYEIFETTNARGVDLSVADLLKNLIFQKIRQTDDRDLAKLIWQDVVSNIQGTSMEMKRFIRYFWISRSVFVPEKKLFKAIKKEITNWDQLLNDLSKDSELINNMLNVSADDWGAYKNGEKIYKSLFAISYMSVSQCYVLLLSILRNYEKIGTDPSRIFQLVEKFTFQYSVVCKLPGNVLEKIYSNHAININKIANGDDPSKISEKIQAIFSELEKDLKSLMPVKAAFCRAFQDIEYKSSTDVRVLIKYLFEKINSFYNLTQENKIDFDNVNIEHILPQKPDKNWGVSKKQIREYVDKLGNLTLVDKRINSEAGNRDFVSKVTILERSNLLVTQKVVLEMKKVGKWGENEILKRQIDLAELIYDQILML